MGNVTSLFLSRLKAKFSQDFLSLLNDAAFVFLYRASGALFVLVTQIVLARWIGPDELGRYVLAFSWCIFLSALAGLGFPRGAARFIGKGLADNRADLVVGYIRRQKQVSLIGGLVITVIAASILLVAGTPEKPAYRDALFLGVIAVPIFAMINTYGATALSMSWFRLAFVPNTLLRPALLLLAICSIWFSRHNLSAHNVMALQIVAAISVLVIQARIVNRHINSRYAGVVPSYETGTWMRTSPQLLIITLFVGYFQDVNIINIGMYLEADQLAIYNVSLRLSFLITFGILAINAISMPKTAQFHASGDREALQKLVTHVARLQLFWALCAVVVVIVLGRYILAIFGPSFVAGHLALVTLALAQLISAMFGPVTQVLSMTGHQDDCLYIFSFSLVAMIVMNHLLIGPFGMNGAAVAVAATFLLQSAWLRILVIRQLGISPSAFKLPGRGSG